MWKLPIFGFWWIFTKVWLFQRWVPIKRRIFFWKDFTYWLFQISADLSGKRQKIHILGLKNEFLGIFASKNTKKNRFSQKWSQESLGIRNRRKMTFEDPRDSFRTIYLYISPIFRLWEKSFFLRKSRFLAFFMKNWVFNFLPKNGLKLSKNDFWAHKNVF